MRIIVETQSRVRASRRTRIKNALLRTFRSLAGVPLTPQASSVTFRRVSRIREAVRNTPLDPLIESRQARAMATGLVIGTAHVAFALANVILGLLSQSVWTLSVGLVITALNIGKSYLASGALMGGAIGGGPETTRSLERCRNAGIALALGMIPMSGTVMRLVVRGYGGANSGLLIYCYAAYTFIQIVVAMVNMVRARREDMVAVKGVRAFNLACALISIFALQTVLLSRVSWTTVPEVITRRVVESAVGGFVCICMTGLGIWLARAASERLAARRGQVRIRHKRRRRRRRRKH